MKSKIIVKTLSVKGFFAIFLLTAIGGCNSSTENESSEATSVQETKQQGGQSNVSDETSEKDVVKVAVSSPDHTTLVAALQAAGLVDVMASSGPYTVFAPTNAAFEALPAGTVDNLLKPENKGALSNILEYHVAVPVYKENYFKDGQTLGMANSNSVTISKVDGKLKVNDANVLGSVMASNGIIYVIDKVLLPPDKK
ncbi:MAG: fasciclin domain-containing protein [Bacteroidia bacterium]